MKNIIGVTGVGGGVGQSIIKSFAGTPFKVIGMDGNVDATGLYMISKGYVIPYANDSTYISRLLEICRKEEIKLLFPGLDAELKILSKNKQKFKDIGTEVIVSSPTVIDISNDKLTTFNFLKDNSFFHPKTEIFDYKKNNIPFPFVIKPRFDGARSKDVYVVKDEIELDSIALKIRDNYSKYICQEYIEGKEYTSGTVTLNGKCTGVIIMERELRNGDTYKCKVIKSEELGTYLKNVIEKLQPYGATNVQFRVKDGIPYIIEFNTRCSGTTAARTLCGFNEPLSICKFYFEGIVPDFRIESKTIFRYWNELIIDQNKMQDLISRV